MSGGRDRSAARTTLGGEFPALALSIREVGASFHPGPRFRRPPCDPGQWAFPSPVLTLASLWSPSQRAHSLSADSHTPRYSLVCFRGRSIVPRPNMSGYSWSCQVPRAPLHVPSVTVHAMMSRTMSTGITPPSSLLQAHAPILPPPRASVVPSDARSVQVAVSPCWEKDLPDVIAAYLSLRAWPPTPAAREVPVPVSSLTTAAFPSFGPGRRSPMYRTATSVRRAFRGCSHSLMFRPAGLLATQIAPTATASTVGQP
jgi:hypothetical protein